MDLLVSSPDLFCPRTHQQLLTSQSFQALACLGCAPVGNCFLKLEGAMLPLAHCLAETAQSYWVAHQVTREIATAVMDLAAEVHLPLEPDCFPRLLARDLLRLPPLDPGDGDQGKGTSW